MIWDLILERFVTLRISEFIHGICQIHAEKNAHYISSYGYKQGRNWHFGKFEFSVDLNNTVNTQFNFISSLKSK